MPVLAGTDTLAATDPDTSITYTYPLRLPLQQIEPGYRQRRYVVESLDYTTRNVITVGSGIAEFHGVIAYDEHPNTLLKVLTLGANGVQVTYYDSRKSLTHYCMLIEPAGDLIALLRETRSAPQFIEYTIPIRLRKNEAGSFDASIPIISS